MSEVKDAIDQLAAKQYDQFSSTVSDLMMDRLKGRIDNEKYAVGQSIFADEPETIVATVATSRRHGVSGVGTEPAWYPRRTCDADFMDPLRSSSRYAVKE